MVPSARRVKDALIHRQKARVLALLAHVLLPPTHCQLVGHEHTRAEHNRFRIDLLNHSDIQPASHFFEFGVAEP